MSDRNEWIRVRNASGFDWSGVVEAMAKLVVLPGAAKGEAFIDMSAIEPDEHRPQSMVLIFDEPILRRARTMSDRNLRR